MTVNGFNYGFKIVRNANFYFLDTCVADAYTEDTAWLTSLVSLSLVSRAPDSFGKESGNFSRVSVCQCRNVDTVI